MKNIFNLAVEWRIIKSNPVASVKAPKVERKRNMAYSEDEVCQLFEVLENYIRFHDLRYTSATLLINQGAHSKIISVRLGQANITTTMNIYGHVLQKVVKEAANKFDEILLLKNRLNT
jgi:integrase